MDPLCGWCYGNSDNVLELFEKYKNEIKFEILPGGMWVGENIEDNRHKWSVSFCVTMQQLKNTPE
jgi:protein-disulfide isomerase-like protein with CxxC motif